ncbi:FAD binding domain-containing protein [Lutibacter sp.]
MIQFILNNTTVSTPENSGMTLLDFIRENKQLKGTKIGCREGDCGACTVLVGTLENNQVTYKSITSCIYPLGNANGKHIVTIEGINLTEQLTTVQHSFLENYATQCGFCTPGFIVSLTGYALQQNEQSTHNCNDAVSGNICRCTGYKSIEKAAKNIEHILASKDANNQISWLIKEGFIPDYFSEIPEKLLKIKNPISSEEGTVVANGTDLYVRFADKLTDEKVHLIADKYKGIEITKNQCTIGASTTVTELLQHKYLQKLFPNLKSFLKLVSSEQIRNMGTLGGNFVNASPIGDMSIFFLALDSTLTIVHRDGSLRKIPFKSFHKDYKQYDLKEGELLKSISFNIFEDNTRFNFEKVSKRTHLDIASVNAACQITISNNKVTAIHLAMGGVAAIPKYLSKTAAFLNGKTISEEIIFEAQKILQEEISPISDVRGTSAYKRLLARQLFYAHFLKLFPENIELKKLITL